MAAVIDTATINFGIAKMASAIQGAIPTLTDVTQKMVHYQVTLAIISVVFMGLWLIALCIAIRQFHKAEIALAKKGDREAYAEPDGAAIAVIILGIVAFGFGIVFFCDVQSAVMAITNPEIYTVMKFIGR